jgi:hypothetical protein
MINEVIEIEIYCIFWFERLQFGIYLCVSKLGIY